MSRSGYSDDYGWEDNSIFLYRASVDRAIKGKRGQKFLQELAKAMDEMPVKELIANKLVTPEGACCTIGVVCKARQISVEDVDIYDPERVGGLVNIARSMAAEIEYENDEAGPRDETPAQRWTRMRKWVAEQLGEADA